MYVNISPISPFILTPSYTDIFDFKRNFIVQPGKGSGDLVLPPQTCNLTS